MLKMESKFLRHESCPKCGSKNNLARYSDGHAHCFTPDCGYYEKGEVEVIPMTNNQNSYSDLYVGQVTSLQDRNITQETANKYGVTTLSQNGMVSKHIYPYYNSHGKHVANKIRTLPKEFTAQGNFGESQLFGQNLFGGGQKYITITEGECDAMAVYELMQGKSSVVSIKRGASSAVKDIRESIEFVESFDNVVLCFDNDKAGIESARQVARILKPSKAKIINLPNGYKDANEMLAKKKFQEFSTAWWEAKTYTPSGIMELSSKKDEWLHREEKESIAYPWEGLNKKLYGMRKGELVTLTGGTGLGKSSVTRELEHHLIKNTKDNVGIIALEENWLRTADGIVSIEANDRIYLSEKRDAYTKDELQALFDKAIQKGRVFIHAHLGATDIEEIFSKLRYIIIGCECDWVVVDHLHMLVNVLTEGDERRGIDMLMNRLRSLVEETGVGMILVSHLRRAQGDRGHEKGIQVSLSHLKGSQGIAQLSDCVIALERNQQAENPEEANITKVRVLKSRYTGDTGMACSLRYDIDTGRLHEITDSETFDNEIDF